jgi:hypothetical protein
MRSKTAIWVFLLAVLAAGIPVPRQCAAQAGLLQGYVLDEETGAPIPFAGVDTFVNDEWYWTNCLEDGSYSLPTEPGTNEVWVWAEGYDDWVEEVFVEDGQTVAYDVYLRPVGDIGRVMGVVKDCDTGEPIRNARVEADTGEYRYTDASGAYSMELPYGMYIIYVEASGYREIFHAVWVGEPSVDLGETCLYRTDLLGVVFGTILDGQTGLPVADAFISLSDYPFYSLSSPDGFYLIEVPPRPVGVLIHAEGYLTYQVDVDLSAGESREVPITLEAEAGFDDHCNEPGECATSLQINGQAAEGGIEAGGDVDWFKFNGTAGVTYVIETTSLGPGSDTVISLYRENGASLRACNEINVALCLSMGYGYPHGLSADQKTIRCVEAPFGRKGNTACRCRRSRGPGTGRYHCRFEGYWHFTKCDRPRH